VKKGNKKVLNALNSALVSLQKDGTVAKIHKKWFNN
jgi:ABC-type amino acid transport substrate-binding protein